MNTPLSKKEMTGKKESQRKRNRENLIGILIFFITFSSFADVVVAADPGHGAQVIGPQDFETGNYSFPDSLVVNGSTYLATQVGNVGINTTSPVALLHLGSGGDNPYFGAGITKLIVQQDGDTSLEVRNSAADIDGFFYAGGGTVYVGSAGAYPLNFQTSNLDRMAITATGLVGVNTTSPQSVLDVVGSGSSLNDYGIAAIEDYNQAGVAIGYDGTTGYSWFYSRDVGSGSLGFNFNNLLYLGNLNGNVGINTSSPSTLLHVATGGSGDLAFTSTGRLGVNTTSPGTVLDVDGPAAFGKTIQNAIKIGPLDTSPSYFYINTKIPYTDGQSPQLKVIGYNYGGSNKAVSFTLSWYNYPTGIDFYFAQVQGDIGYYMPSTIRLGTWDDSGTTRVRIEIANDGTYWSSYTVSAFDSNGASSSYNGWTYGLGSFPGDTLNITNATQYAGVVYSNTGNLGIGTTNPANTLNVIGDLNVTGTSYLGNLNLAADNITVNNLISLNGNITFSDSGSVERMRVTSAGRVAIGMENPDQMLDVAGNIDVNGNSIYLGTAGNLYLWSDTGHVINVKTISSFFDGAAQYRDTWSGAGSQGIAFVTDGGTSPVFEVDGTKGDAYVNGTLFVNEGINATGYVNASTDLCIEGGACLSSTALASNYWARSGSSLYPTTVTDLVGINTSSPTEALEVKGNVQVTAADSANYQAKQIIEHRTVDVNAGDITEIGNFTFLNGAGMIDIDYIAHVSGYSIAAKYILPIQYGNNDQGLNDVWLKAQPISYTGVYNNEVELDVRVNGQVTMLRLRRVSGSEIADHTLNMKVTGNPITYTPSAFNTSGVTPPTTVFGAATLTQRSAKVGIGTTAPAQTLNVIGDLNVTGISYLGNLDLRADNITVNNLIALNADMTFSNSSASESMRITQDNKVGIGTQSPNARLNIASDGALVIQLQLDDTRAGGKSWALTSGSTGSPAPGTGNFGIYDVTANKFPLTILQSSGNVGINTTAPIDIFDVNAQGGHVFVNNTEGSIQGTNIATQQVENITTAVGYAAGNGLGSSPVYETAFGAYAANGNTADYVTAMGVESARSNNGTQTTTIGYQAGYSNTAGFLTAVGMYAGRNNQGHVTTAVGYEAGYQNYADHLTAVGFLAGYQNRGSVNAFIGTQTGQENNGSNSVAMGYLAGYQNSGEETVMLGLQSGQQNTGHYLQAVGYQTGYLNTGAFLSALGYQTGYQNTGGQVTALGARAGYGNNGSDVVAIGYQAGLNNVVNNQFIVQQNNINTLPLVQGDFSTNSFAVGGYPYDTNTTTVYGNLNVTGTSYLGTVTLSADNLTVNNLISLNADMVFHNSSSSEMMRITQTGKVGIGTQNVNYKLTIYDATAPTISQETPNYRYLTGLLADDGVYHIKRSDGFVGDKLVIDATGNVGINTSSPGATVEISTDNPNLLLTDQDATVRSANITLGTAGGTWTINQNNDLNFITETTPAMTILRFSGAVGIGTTAPVGNLSVATSGGVSAITSDYGCSGYAGWGGNPTVTGCANYAILADGTNTLFNRPSGGNLYFREANSDQMFIASGGNVGIGTTNPANKLNIIGDLNVTGTSYLGNANIAADNITVNNIIALSGDLAFHNSSGTQLVSFTQDTQGGLIKLSYINGGTYSIGTAGGGGLTLNGGPYIFVGAGGSYVGTFSTGYSGAAGLTLSPAADQIGLTVNAGGGVTANFLGAGGTVYVNGTEGSIQATNINTELVGNLTTFVGTSAGAGGGATLQSTGVGYQAGLQNAGDQTTFFGYSAGYQNNGSGTVGIGDIAGYQNYADFGTFVGHYAGYLNAGRLVVGLGYQAAQQNAGSNTVAIGYLAAYANTRNEVSVIGLQAGQQNTGYGLVSLGYQAGLQNTGDYSTAIGYNAGYGNNGSHLVAMGYEAGKDNTGANTVFLGYQAGYQNTADNQFILKHLSANSVPLMQGDFGTSSLGIGGKPFDTNTTTVYGNLNVTGTSFLGSLTLSADNISVNNLISLGGNITFNDNAGNERMHMASNGYIGIGTINPTDKLHVDTSLTIAPTENITGANGDAKLTLASNDIYDEAGLSQSAIIQFGGKVGNGGPAYALYNFINWTSGKLYFQDDRFNKIVMGNTGAWGQPDVNILPSATDWGVLTVGASSDSGRYKLAVHGNMSLEDSVGGGTPYLNIENTGANAGSVAITGDNTPTIAITSGTGGVPTLTMTASGYTQTITESEFTDSFGRGYGRSLALGNGNANSLYFTRYGGSSNVPHFAFVGTSGGANTETMLDVLDSTNNKSLFTIKEGGNVGIGTTTPVKIAHIVGVANQDILRVDAGITHSLNFGTNDSSPFAWYIQARTNGGATTYPISLNPEGGNVGIGTVAPANTLNVVGDLNVTGTSYLGNANIAADNITVNNIISLDNNMTFSNSSSSEIMRITPEGNVGIGTTIPSAKLDVVGESISGAQYRNNYLTAIHNRQAYYSFDGTQIDTTEWDNSSVTQNEKLTFASGASSWNDGIISKAVFHRSHDLVLEADVTPTADGYFMIGWHNDNPTFSYTQLTHAIYFAAGGDFVIYEDGGSPNDPSPTWAVGQKYRVRIVLKAAGGASYYYSTDGGRTWTTLWAGDSDAATTPLRVGVSYYNGNFDVDNWEVYSAAGPNTVYGDRGNVAEVSGNVGIGTAVPNAKLTVGGDINATGYINASTDVCVEGGKCLSATTTNAVSASEVNHTSMRAQSMITGGGTITWTSGTSTLTWGTRFIWIPVNKDSSTNGYFQLDPSSAVIGQWSALYARCPFGSGSVSCTAETRTYTDAIEDMSDWFLVASRNSDTEDIIFADGTVIPVGRDATVTGGLGNVDGWISTGTYTYAGVSGTSVGIGEISPGSKLAVAGGVSIGSSYSQTAAPTNGLLVEGFVGINNTAPGQTLTVGSATMQNSMRIYGTAGANQAPVISLFKSGEREGFIYQGTGGPVGIGTSGGLANYNDITLAANAKLFIELNGVGINTTTPMEIFDVNANGGHVYVNNTQGSIQATNLKTESEGNQTTRVGFIYSFIDQDQVEATSVGWNALSGGTGDYSTAVGGRAAYNQNGSFITAVGDAAGYSNVANYITAVGASAAFQNAGDQAAAFGYQALYQNSGVGSFGMGANAGYQNTGGYLIAIGYNAGNQNTGYLSSMIGYEAGYTNTGGGLTAYGRQAGKSNSGENVVALGYDAGNGNTGNYGVFIGEEAGAGNTVANQFILKQNSARSTPLIQGDFATGNLNFTGNITIDNTIRNATDSQKITFEGGDVVITIG